MAKQYVTTKGTIKIPGAYPSYTVQSSPGGLSTTGVLMLVGEADGGPHWSAETDLETNAFGPDSLAEVIAKYQSGNLVDAFRGAIAASNDPGIVGSFSRAVLVKTNSGTKASLPILKLGPSTAYATLYDKSFGTKGNQTSVAVAATVASVLPTTDSFTYIPVAGTTGISMNLAFRANGLASGALAVPQNQTPTAFVAAVAAATSGSAGINATGGVNRNILSGSSTVAIAVVSGNSVTFTITGTWAVTPVAGDTLIVASTAPALFRDPTGGVADDNVGAYVVTGATSTAISATKLSDAGRTSSTPVSGLTAPLATVGSVAAVLAADLVAYSPVTITLDAANVIPGAGKSLEIACTDSVATASVQLASAAFFGLGTTTAASWISTSAAPVLLTSSAESKVTLTASRALDNASESFLLGGEIPLKVGYSGSAVTLSVSATQLTTSGGSLPLTLNLADYATIQALADYINAQSGYSASVGTAALGFLPPTALDRVSAIGISSQFGTVQPGRIKIDAYRTFNAISEGSRLLMMGNPATRPDAGLPAVMATTFMSGGLKGGTNNGAVTAALAALESVDGNFVIPLFSRDASADIVDGKTDSTSLYTIAGVNLAAKSHVLAMSTFRARKSRQALSSIQAAFQAQQDAAANTASYRVCMPFQNVKDSDANGDIQTFQPWMAAIKAASMQAAGFYRSIENKKTNITGITHIAGDFNPKSDSHVEAALTAGLMPLRQSRTGGFVWVSDQTTYGSDDNFVFNSLQAVYAADTIALTTGQRMEQAFVGQSVADANAQVALTYLDQIMADFLRLKLIAPSDDAKKGYKNASIRISGNVMLVSVEIKLATAIDFVVIDFLVSPVTQTA